MTQGIVYLLARGVLRAMEQPRVTRITDTSMHEERRRGRIDTSSGGRKNTIGLVTI